MEKLWTILYSIVGNKCVQMCTWVWISLHIWKREREGERILTFCGFVWWFVVVCWWFCLSHKLSDWSILVYNVWHYVNTSVECIISVIIIVLDVILLHVLIVSVWQNVKLNRFCIVSSLIWCIHYCLSLTLLFHEIIN